MNSLKNKRLSAILDSHDEILLVLHRKPPPSSTMVKYNITDSEWRDMANSQDYCCAICGKHQPKKRLAIDHDHKTGKIRGLLCSNCNTALGLLKDNISIAESAVKYLKRHK